MENKSKLRPVVPPIVPIATLLAAMFMAASAFSQNLSPEATEDLLAQAKQMVIKGELQDAYDALSPHEFQLAGNVDYDYLFGTAALDTGRVDEASFALERALEEQPAFAGARVELARAYYESNRLEEARYHFEYLLAQNPPSAVRQVITSYLRNIERESAVYKPIHIPQIAAGFGYDTNANASTGDDRFLFFFLDDRNVETESPYYYATVADYYSRPLSNRWRLILNGALGQRNYPDASFVDATNVNANIGFEYNGGDTKVYPTLITSYNWLDGEKNLGRVGGDLLINHAVAEDWRLLGGLTAVAHRYDGALKIRDVDIFDGRFGFEHYMDTATGSTIAMTATFGTDKAKDSESIFENDHWSVQLNGSRLVARNMLLGLTASYKETEYKGAGFPGLDANGNLVGVARDDDEFRASATLNWFEWPGTGWRTAAELKYSDVESSVDLYSYDRVEAGLSFYRSFN